MSVTQQSGQFHSVYWDMTTGLLINIHCLFSPVTHESWVNFDRISLLPSQDQFQGLCGGGFEQVHLRHIKFSQKLFGVLGKEETLPWPHQCSKLHSTTKKKKKIENNKKCSMDHLFIQQCEWILRELCLVRKPILNGHILMILFT